MYKGDTHSMKTNFELSDLEDIASVAKDIRVWIGNKSHPEQYIAVKDLDLVRGFISTLDLLETVLTNIRDMRLPDKIST